MRNIIFDLRVSKGVIWNIPELLSQYPFGDISSQWNSGVGISSEIWVDQFVYEGFHKHGEDFLRALKGKFSTLFFDETKKMLFLARDWIGEIPYHYLTSENGLFFSNSIKAIKDETKGEYRYENIRSFPQSHYQLIDLSDIDEHHIAASYRPDKRKLFLDFEAEVLRKKNVNRTADFARLADVIKASIIERSAKGLNAMNHLLLSGGLDSLSIAVAMKAVGLTFETYTLSVDGKAGEAEMAAMFAQKLGVTHHVIDVTTDEIVSSYGEAVQAAEIYHIYNVYCTLGMLLVGKKLAALGIRKAFCGEAMNEAVGDYKDWTVFNPVLKRNVLIQKINTKRLQNIKERILYVWGHSEDKGKYNRQQGTGLAKHAGARMIKPFLKSGLELECPYYERDFLSSIIALDAGELEKIGYKPGLLWQIFKDDFLKYGFDEVLIKSCKKVRFQDNTENGDSGISSVLITIGNDQEKTLSIFNSIFKSNYDITEKSKSLLCTS